MVQSALPESRAAFYVLIRYRPNVDVVFAVDLACISSGYDLEMRADPATPVRKAPVAIGISGIRTPNIARGIP